MGNRIFGCDDCLAVCPWNKFARSASEIRLGAREELQNRDLGFFLTLDDAKFRKLFSRSPVKRIGRNRFMRNVLIAVGNSGIADYLDDLKTHVTDPHPLVRGAAVWALRMLGEEDMIARLRNKHLTSERDENVRREWSCDLNEE